MLGATFGKATQANTAGDLEDGDNSQIGTLKELQRLYDELVKSADACRLDRYSDYGKASRSRWLWSRLIPQSSVSPVKGLYLYGGVGTEKTMLMDLFYDQLPCNWRKKRIHFHDFTLTVHSRLQVTDVADALILNRLFSQLFSNGAPCYSIKEDIGTIKHLYYKDLAWKVWRETRPPTIKEGIGTIKDLYHKALSCEKWRENKTHQLH